ncbi:hypothetical protein ACJIZ3_025513 [Penstemon smallii]|uniref:Auxin-responsive protein n=1 Tax=Penstemon smallii TaxID=265156 RepID=A0ABD3TXG6_9LAMI
MSLNNQLESEYSGSLKTELTLGLPGGAQAPKSAVKRGFSDTVDLNLYTNSEDEVNVATHTQPPPAKGQVVGWPPVRSYMKKKMMTVNCKYVKVAVDGAPYLRKLDLQIYTSYKELLVAFQNMFTCLTICNVIANESKIVDISNGTEYLPAYEDKDGDWMLVGDVPWNMFVESCKRLRLIKSCEKLKLMKSSASLETSSSTSC